jgi:UDP-glucuronate 4-epimerase
MSPILFASAIQSGQPVKVFNNGKMMRDFTYIDDIVEGILQVLVTPSTSNKNWDAHNPSTESSKVPYRIYNIGNATPVELMYFIETLEKAMGKKATKDFLPMQDGDVMKTFADVSELEADFNYHPTTSVELGVVFFVNWFKKYYLK